MGKLKIKKEDTVLVLAGTSKGSKGKVVKVIPNENRAIVEGVNMVSKHTKPNAANPQGGIVKQESPIHISNLLLVDPETGKSGRVYKKRLEDGSMVRMVKSGRR